MQRCPGEKEASTFGEAERLQQCEGGSCEEDATREGLHLGAGAQAGLTQGSGYGVVGGLHGGRRGPHDLRGGSWGGGWTCPLRRGGREGDQLRDLGVGGGASKAGCTRGFWLLMLGPVNCPQPTNRVTQISDTHSRDTHTHTHTHTHTQKYTGIHMYTRVHTHTGTHTYPPPNTHTCTGTPHFIALHRHCFFFFF